MQNYLSMNARFFTPSSAQPAVDPNSRTKELHDVVADNEAGPWNEGANQTAPNAAASGAPTERDHLLAQAEAEKITEEPRNLTCKEFMARPSVLARLGVSALGIVVAAVSLHVGGEHFHDNDANPHSLTTSQIAAIVACCAGLVTSISLATLLGDCETSFGRRQAAQ